MVRFDREKSCPDCGYRRGDPSGTHTTFAACRGKTEQADPCFEDFPSPKSGTAAVILLVLAVCLGYLLAGLIAYRIGLEMLSN